MALGENQSNISFIKATPFQASASTTGQQIRASAGGLHSIIIGSHSALAFKLWDSATGPANAIFGTFTPPAGSVMYDFAVPIEFTNGLWMTIIPETSPTGSISFNVN